MATEFTPFLSMAGGALIGLAAVIKMAANGRIAGVSGIVARILPPHTDRSAIPESAAFVIGLLLAIPLVTLVTGSVPAQAVSGSLALLAVAGLLVGFGAVIGSGCTSGHGVCGISRLSMRSILATVTFMATGAGAVFVLRHVLGA